MICSIYKWISSLARLVRLHRIKIFSVFPKITNFIFPFGNLWGVLHKQPICPPWFWIIEFYIGTGIELRNKTWTNLNNRKRPISCREICIVQNRNEFQKIAFKAFLLIFTSKISGEKFVALDLSNYANPKILIKCELQAFSHCFQDAVCPWDAKQDTVPSMLWQFLTRNNHNCWIKLI